MGCCFSHDSSREELIGPHRPQTNDGATSSFQPHVASNNNTIVSPSYLQAHISNIYQSPTSTNRLTRSQWRNQEQVSHNRPKPYFEAYNRFQPFVTGTNNTTVSSSSLRAHNWNSYHAPPSRNYSRLASSQRIINRSHSSYSLVKTVESTLHKSVLQLTVEWDHMNASSEFELCLLLSDTTEYEEILRLFKKTTQKQFMVEKIYRVQNPYLLGCYLLKKQEMESRYGYVAEEYLFHGTKEENKDKICRNNFDWRNHGRSAGNTFGKGVSFTPISCYASHYSDKHSSQRLMFVSKVLIAHETVGHKSMKIPPLFAYRQCLRYDTTTKENRHVIVKYSDNEFYPAYIVYYTGQYEKKEQGQLRL
ncbi:protein mono-ADP-ribosyltransferase PARP11-like [Schistocerca nitens]|uniref:protein mono-ADP-ribosyltransferase PARP11-like n=1 Tax=Schistocerca nitens TaxID=7011 RepID=UPI002117422C|nr:protein mono-ADP-ribosyltransferase PARP11-like [Schistocerca nitens]XP_049812560.1 protein mono-ADP-ribosyltransferase PARP11-like [Schistocerca nitens]XP_049812561.1 protein mono-ADP-ribosyltransferase PARP11-like [Schistocerca nitens]